MDKSEFYTMCVKELKSKNDPASVSHIKQLTRKVMTGALSVDQALNEMRDTKLPEHSALFESIRKKKVGKSLKEYYSAELSGGDTVKMLSSVITHCIIESSLNESFKLDSNVANLSNSLTEYIVTGNINSSLINESLSNLGITKEVVLSE